MKIFYSPIYQKGSGGESELGESKFSAFSLDYSFHYSRKRRQFLFQKVSWESERFRSEILNQNPLTKSSTGYLENFLDEYFLDLRKTF